MKKIVSIASTGIFRLIILFMTIVPIVYCDFPWWVSLIILFALNILPGGLGGILTIALWVWSFINVLNSPFSVFTVIYLVFFVLYLVFCFIPAIITLLQKRS